MVININKIKEMLRDPLSKFSPDKLFIGQTKVERVTGFKLLGHHKLCEVEHTH